MNSLRWFLLSMLITPSVWAFQLTSDFLNGFYWASLPISITVIESDPTRKQTIETLAKSAIGEWETRTGFNLWDFTKTTSTQASSNIIRWSTNFAAETKMDPNSVLAVAIRYTSGPYFARTEIVINGNHFMNFDINNLLTTITHELGHTQGLDHSENSAAVMAPSLQSNYVGLHSDDVKGMKSAYSVSNERQVTGYISPLAYSEEKQSSPLSCGTVGPATASAGVNGGVSLGFGILIAFVRKVFMKLKAFLKAH